uniref:hypothetical protein n=1 Tax=uncultured Erythrobacter sp. TaxID=263913 RepID=UPI002609D9DD|nr:hypothetical protein [uncultured Erythrobacter sp.]
MRNSVCLMLAMALSACGTSPADEAAPPEPLETPIPVEPDGGIGDGAEPLPQEASQEQPAGAANVIPAGFHGVWDYEGGTCALESDMRMEISASEIMFYESIGIVTAVSPDGEDTLVALAMEGEGETWEQSTRLSLVGEGDDVRLHTSDGDAPKQIDEYPSKKCPE